MHPSKNIVYICVHSIVKIIEHQCTFLYFNFFLFKLSANLFNQDFYFNYSEQLDILIIIKNRE